MKRALFLVIFCVLFVACGGGGGGGESGVQSVTVSPTTATVGQLTTFRVSVVTYTDVTCYLDGDFQEYFTQPIENDGDNYIDITTTPIKAGRFSFNAVCDGNRFPLSVNLVPVVNNDEYTVSLNANGGEFEKPIVGTAVPSPYDTLVTEGVFNLPLVAGLEVTAVKSTSPNVFQGYYTDAIGGTPISGLIPVTADVTYFAHWGYSAPTTYRLELYPNGGTLGNNAEKWTVDVYDGSVLHFDMYTDLSRAGYTFKGWYDAPVDGNKMDDIESISAIDSYYAQWTAIGGGNNELILPGGNIDEENMFESDTIEVYYSNGERATSKAYSDYTFPEIVLTAPSVGNLTDTDFSDWWIDIATSVTAKSTAIYITDSYDDQLWCNADPTYNSFYSFVYSDSAYSIDEACTYNNENAMDCIIDMKVGWNAILISGISNTITTVPVPASCYWANE